MIGGAGWRPTCCGSTIGAVEAEYRRRYDWALHERDIAQARAEAAELAVKRERENWNRVVDGEQEARSAAEGRVARLEEALTRVLEWPQPRGTVESYLPRWLREIARSALSSDAAKEPL